MTENPPLMSTTQVANRLGIHRNTLKNHVEKENWEMVPKPKPQKVCADYRWEQYVVEAFINGEKTDYTVAKSDNLPYDWSKHA